MARGSLDSKYKNSLVLRLQETSILGTKEEPLHAEQGILSHFGILVVHELHDSVLRLEVCHHYAAGRMVLKEL